MRSAARRDAGAGPLVCAIPCHYTTSNFELERYFSLQRLNGVTKKRNLVTDSLIACLKHDSASANFTFTRAYGSLASALSRWFRAWLQDLISFTTVYRGSFPLRSCFQGDEVATIVDRRDSVVWHCAATLIGRAMTRRLNVWSSQAYLRYSFG